MASGIPLSSSPIETPQLVPDIRHGTTLSPLTTPHRSKGGGKVGSLSPGSIPSSPTSVHSTSSAIFERDIEPLPAMSVISSSSAMALGMGSTLGVSPNPHRTPRGRQAEDSAVPSVLTTAANALVSLPVSPAPSAPASPARPHAPPLDSIIPGDPFVVIAPTSQIIPTASTSSARSGRASRETSPGRASFFERKPRRQSTTGSIGSGSGSGSSPPMSISNALSLSPGSVPATAPSASPPALGPLALPPPLPAVPAVGLNLGEAALAAASPGHRLSFISYNDLLLSAPVSAVPLTALTQPVSSEPPPHLPSTFPTNPDPSKTTGVGLRSGTHTPGSRSRPRSVVLNNRTSVLLGTGPDAPGVEGGEWEREGLGRGLEERLEELLKREQQVQQSQAPPSVAGTA